MPDPKIQTSEVLRLAADESALRVHVRRLGIAAVPESAGARNKQRREYAALLDQMNAATEAYESAFRLWMAAGFPDDGVPA